MMNSFVSRKNFKIYFKKAGLDPSSDLDPTQAGRLGKPVVCQGLGEYYSHQQQIKNNYNCFRPKTKLFSTSKQIPIAAATKIVAGQRRKSVKLRQTE